MHLREIMHGRLSSYTPVDSRGTAYSHSVNLNAGPARFKQ